jgi:hypothetical protein
MRSSIWLRLSLALSFRASSSLMTSGMEAMDSLREGDFFYS